MSEIADLSLENLARSIREGELSSSEVLQFYLKAIDEEENNLNAFITVFPKEALSRAKNIDSSKSKKGKLFGVPIALKDNIVTRDLRTTAGSKIIENYIPQYDATVTSSLLGEGAIVLGKTNMDEFAMGSSTENSAYGPTKNPHDLERVPGGSSGGSAAAVAAGLSPAALGTDTGGSIKQPAAFCGVVGLRPTYGAVSRYGVIALTSSLDQVGTLAKTVADARYLFGVISGKDPYDATSLNPITTKSIGIRKLKVGLPKEYFGEGLDKGISSRIKKVAEFLEGLGAKIENISLPHTEYGLAVYYIINPSEASANLARFDGVRYGYRADAKDIEELYRNSRGTGFGEEPKRRIILGTFSLSSGYTDQFYLKAAKMRTLVIKDFENVFSKVDVVLTPTTPTAAFKIGEKKDPLSMYLSDTFTIPSNLSGLPGLSVPVGKIDSLPVGAQIIGPKFSEELLFSVGEVLEKEKWS